jgi:hypothetical protein
MPSRPPRFSARFHDGTGGVRPDRVEARAGCFFAAGLEPLRAGARSFFSSS